MAVAADSSKADVRLGSVLAGVMATTDEPSARSPG